jgi:hypothetical protein
LEEVSELKSVKVQFVIRKMEMLIPTNFRNEMSILEEQILLTTVLVFCDSYAGSVEPWEGSVGGTSVFHCLRMPHILLH